MSFLLLLLLFIVKIMIRIIIALLYQTSKIFMISRLTIIAILFLKMFLIAFRQGMTDL
jgi:hypothetical protein